MNWSEPTGKDLEAAAAESAWIAEIEKRARELADGSVTPVGWDEAREHIKRRLNSRHA